MSSGVRESEPCAWNVMASRHKGGIEASFLDYCRMLGDAGYRVCAVNHPATPYASSVAARVWGRVSAGFDNVSLLPDLVRLGLYARRQKPRIVICHDGRSARLAKRLRALRLLGGARLIGVKHNTGGGQFRGFDEMICVNRGLIDEVRALGIPVEKIRLLHHACESPVVAGSEVSPREWRNLDRRGFTMGFLGRLHPTKGLPQLIQSVQVLCEKGYEPSLRLAGEGDSRYRMELEDLARDLGVRERIEFLGWVDDKAAFFSSLDFYMMSSLEESFGLVNLEAMHHGVPVIAFANAGAMEIDPEGNCIKFADAFSPLALARAVEELVQNPDDLQARLGRRQTLLARFSYEAVSRRFREILQAGETGIPS